MRTVCGSEFQTDGAENRKARLEKSVLMNGWSSSGMDADERKVRLQARSGIRRYRQTGVTVDVLRSFYVRTANLYVRQYIMHGLQFNMQLLLV